MNGTIQLKELPPELRKKFKLEAKPVPDKVIALGKVFIALQGQTTRDAYWILRTASSYVLGYKRTTRRSRQQTVNKREEVSK